MSSGPGLVPRGKNDTAAIQEPACVPADAKAIWQNLVDDNGFLAGSEAGSTWMSDDLYKRA